MLESRMKRVIVGLMLANVWGLAACSKDGAPGAESTPPPAAEQKPLSVADAQLKEAELLIYAAIPSITQEEFQRTMEAPIRAKYPHYKLRYLNSGGIEPLVVTGDAPDIVITSLTGMNATVNAYNLQYDLSELIKKYNYDLSHLEPSTVESIRNATENGGLYGLPKYLNGVVVFYNKDMFDRFGVSYPKDGMTWDEATRLAARMTRSQDGVNYRGMSMFYNNMIVENQLSLPLLDPVADKAAVNVPGFQKLFQTFKGIYDIIGNKPEGAVTAERELTAFHVDKNVAMVAAPLSGSGRFASDASLNWDVVAAPTFPDAPGVGYQPNTIYYFVSDVNKKAEQAFQVVAHLLTKEPQLLSSREGRGTVLTDKDVRATLGQDNPAFRDKNFAALYFNKFAPTPPPNPKLATRVNAATVMNTEFAAMIRDGLDVNTMLRQAEEKINRAIAEALSK